MKIEGRSLGRRIDFVLKLFYLTKPTRLLERTPRHLATPRPFAAATCIKQHHRAEISNDIALI